MKTYLAALTLALAVFSTPVFATNYYVSAFGGDDKADGTSRSPWSTIVHAAAVAVAGDTVTVSSGTYPGSITQSANGTSTKPIVFRGVQGAAKPVIVGAKGDPNYAVWLAGNNVTWRGFEIYGASASWSIGIYATGSKSIVDGNLLHHIAGALCDSQGAGGIVTDHFYGGVHINVTGNEVHHIGPVASCNVDQGIYIETSGTVKNNKSHDNAGWGIATYHDATNVKIIGNDVYSNGSNSGGISVGCGGFYTLKSCDYFQVMNNNVHDEPNIGLLGATASRIYQGYHSIMSGNILTNDMYPCVDLDMIDTGHQVCPPSP